MPKITLVLPTYHNCDAYNDFKTEFLALDWLISLAQQHQASCDLQFFSSNHRQSLPIAALTGCADGLNTDTGYWLRADPCDLRYDLNAVYHYGIRHLELNLTQAQKIVDAINPLLADAGMHMFAPNAYRWYIRSNDNIELSTTTPEQAFGTAVQNYSQSMPKNLRLLSAEIEMLLKQLDVNQNLRRSITGLWFWGSGQLPCHQLRCAADTIVGDCVVSRGIAHRLGINYFPIDYFKWNTIADQGSLLMSCHYLARFEANFLSPIISLMQRRFIESLDIYLGGSELYSIKSTAIPAWWQFWRKTRLTG